MVFRKIPQAEDAGEGKVLAFNRTVVGTPKTKEDFTPFETTYEGDSKDRHFVYQRAEDFVFYPKKEQY